MNNDVHMLLFAALILRPCLGNRSNHREDNFYSVLMHLNEIYACLQPAPLPRMQMQMHTKIQNPATQIGQQSRRAPKGDEEAQHKPVIPSSYQPL